MKPREYDGRALIICALDEEADAIRPHLQNIQTIQDHDGFYRDVGVFYGDNSKWEVVLAVSGKYADSAIITLTQVYMVYRPDIVMMPGIAMRVKDVNLADVVASERSIDVSKSKHTDDGTTYRPDSARADGGLVSLAHVVRGQGKWKERRLHPAPLEDAKAFVQPYAMAHSVEKSDRSEVMTAIREVASDAVVYEMESFGVLRTAEQYRLQAIITKAASDSGAAKEEEESAGYRDLALDSSAAFTMEMLNNIVIANPDPTQRSLKAISMLPVDNTSPSDSDSKSQENLELPTQIVDKSLSWTEKDEENWVSRDVLQGLLSKIRKDVQSFSLLTGSPGSGKTTIAKKLCYEIDDSVYVLAFKADALPPNISDEEDLSEYLDLDCLASDWVFRRSTEGKVVVCIDQLDAIAALADLKTSRLHTVLQFVKTIADRENVHIVLTSREFEADYDARLRSIDSDKIKLANFTDDELGAFLSKLGVDIASAPSRLRQLVTTPKFAEIVADLHKRNPQLLKDLGNYHAALDLLVSQMKDQGQMSPEDEERLLEVASFMASQESLWVSISALNWSKGEIEKLVALSLLTQSEDGRRVAFSHQTYFDHWFSRWALTRAGDFLEYVKERQTALFVRPRVWSVLVYARDVFEKSYKSLCEGLWFDSDVKTHLKYLLIDHLANAVDVSSWEAELLRVGVEEMGFELRVMRATAGKEEWFDHFDSSGLIKRLIDAEARPDELARWLTAFWEGRGEKVRAYLELIESKVSKESFQRSLMFSIGWSSEATSLAIAKLLNEDAPISAKETAIRRIATYSSNEAVTALSEWLDHEQGKEDKELRVWVRDSLGRANAQYTMIWLSANEVASDDPESYLREVGVRIAKILSRVIGEDQHPMVEFPHAYIYDLDHSIDEMLADYSALGSIDVAASKLSETSPEILFSWLESMGRFESMPIQRILAYFYAKYIPGHVDEKIEFLLSDERRLLLGPSTGNSIADTAELIENIAEHASKAQARRLVDALWNWSPSLQKDLSPEAKRHFFKRGRAIKVALLSKFPTDNRNEEVNKLISEQKRSSDTAEIDSIEGGVSWIGSRMKAADMEKASIADIEKYLLELPDSTEWDHPKHFEFGGSIQASRTFGELARKDIKKAVKVMRRLPPKTHERPVAHAIESFGRDDEIDASEDEVFALVEEFWNAGFSSNEFIGACSSALQAVANRSDGISEKSISWLFDRMLDSAPDSADQVDNIEDWPEEKGSILYGYGAMRTVPTGLFSIFFPIYLGTLRRNDPDLNILVDRLMTYLSLEKSTTSISFLCTYLHWLLRRLDKPRSTAVFSSVLEISPSAIVSQSGAILLARIIGNLEESVVSEVLKAFRDHDHDAAQLAAGELFGMAYVLGQNQYAEQVCNSIFKSSNCPVPFAVGLANTAINFWPDTKRREKVFALLKNTWDLAISDLRIDKAFGDFFRINDPVFDHYTLRVYELFANRPKAAIASGGYALSDHLVELAAQLPRPALMLLSALVDEMVRESSLELRDNFQFELSEAATSAALTLQRYDQGVRAEALDIFEKLLTLEVPSAHQSVVELDDHRVKAGESFVPRRRSARKRPRRRLSQ